MILQQQIKEQIKDAMRAKEGMRLLVLRGILAAFTNELIAKKRKPTEELSDEDALAVISRLVKQRKDSIEQYRKGDREDLASNEEEEMKILQIYLPEMMGEDEIRKVVENKKKELGVEDKSKIGILMGSIMKDLKGKADGALVKKIIEESL